MVPLAIFALSLLIIFVVVLGFRWSKKRRESLDSSYGHLATRYRGRVPPATSSGYPSATFDYQGARVVVDILATSDEDSTSYYTQFHINWPNRSFRFQIHPERFLASAGKFFGMQDHVIGSHQFDQDYIINGNDLAAIQSFLTPTMQRKIDELRRAGNDDIFVRVQGGQLLIKKRGLIEGHTALARFTEHCLSIYDEAVGSRGEGTVFSEGTASPATGVPYCQVCGEVIQSSRVVCGGCRTPHHKECWVYNNGRCSTYGCSHETFEDDA